MRIKMSSKCDIRVIADDAPYVLHEIPEGASNKGKDWGWPWQRLRY